MATVYVFPSLVGSVCVLRVPFFHVASAAAADSEYVIGVEDVISVIVRGRSDLSGSFAVGPEGTLTVPFIGEVKAAGLTVSQFSQELNRKLSVFQAGEATVAVAEYNSRKVFVVGEVEKPGKYSFPVIPTVWNVLNEAGGPTASALLSAVQIIRARTGEIITVDVRKLLAGVPQEQVKLEPGDTVRVPRKITEAPEGNVVFVLGEVRTPGIYEASLTTDVVAAIAAAGGYTDRAELRKVMLVRREASRYAARELDFRKFLKQGFISANPEVKPGDTIMVPATKTWLSTFFSPAVLTAVLSATASIIIITRD